MKKYLKIIFTLIILVYSVTLLPKVFVAYLKNEGWICTLEKHRYFQVIAGKKITINDSLIVAYNFKEKSYIGFSMEKHLFPKEDLERDLKDEHGIMYEYKDFNKNEVIEAVDCRSPHLPPVSYIVFENSKKQQFFMTDYYFRRLKFSTLK